MKTEEQITLGIGAAFSTLFLDFLGNLFLTCLTMSITVILGFFLQRYLKRRYKD